jgi:stage II sporulation protein AA (anti-sigma F factor antagonist)
VDVIGSEPIAAGHVIAIRGEADLTAADALDRGISEAVRNILASARERRIMFDFSEGTFIDSRCLGVLVDRARELRSHGWQLPIVGADSHMRRFFTLMGLDESFEFFETQAAAIATPPATTSDSRRPAQ